MAIIIGEDPKVERRSEHFDAKVISEEEPWDSLNLNIQQPEMQIAAANLMKGSSQDPTGSIGRIHPKMEDSMFDLSDLVAFSPTMSNEQEINFSLLVNTDADFPRGIDDICKSELNTPDITDLDGFVFRNDVIPNDTSSYLEDSDPKQNSDTGQTNLKTDHPSNFPTRHGSPCSPELISQGLLISIDEYPPEHIFDSSSDEKEIQQIKNIYNNNDNIETYTELATFENKVDIKAEMENNKIFADLQSENYLNNILSTINYGDLSEENLLAKCLSSDEILDQEKELMVNSFLNFEEDEEPISPDYFAQSLVNNNENSIINNNNSRSLNRESILNSFQEAFGEPAVLINNVKYVTTKTKVEPAVQNSQPKPEPIVVTIDNENTFIKNDFLFSMQQNNLNDTPMFKAEISEVSPSTSKVTSVIANKDVFPSTSTTKNIPQVQFIGSKPSKRKIKLPGKYKDEISSDIFEDEEPSTIYRPKKRSKFSLQGLTDAEKYQRIRQQNNLASKKCRDNKKRQQQGQVKELERAESLSKQLKTQLQLLEIRRQKWRELCKSISCPLLY